MNFINKAPLLPLTVLVLIYASIYVTLRKTPTSDKGVLHYGIVENVRNTSSGQNLTVKISSGERIRLTVPSIECEFIPGDSVKFNAELRIPVKSNPYENDFVERMKRNGINYMAFVPPDSISVISSSSSLIWCVKRMKPELYNLLAKTRLNDNACEFLSAAIIGDTYALSADTRDIFSTAGVAHILALSGLHVGIIAAILMTLLAPISLFGARKFKITITIVILWIYALLTGLSPSVTRAVIMATAIGVGFIIGRRNFAFNALCLAAIIILLINPAQVVMPGFQMSFAAAGAIIIIAPLIKTGRKNRLKHYVVSSLIITFIATACAGAIAAFHFHSFPLYFIIANIPALALLPVILSGGIMVIIFECLALPSGWICEFVNFTYGILHSLIKFIAGLPGASIQGLHFSYWAFIPYFTTIAVIILALYKKKKILYYATGIGTVLTIICFGYSRKNTIPEDCFIIKASGYSCIFYRHNNNAAIFSTAPQKIKEEAANEIERKYSDYLSLHKVDSVIAINSSTSFGNTIFDGQVIDISGNRYALIGKDYDISMNNKEKTDYCLIAKGYRGDILDIVHQINADTILLGSDLDIRRHNRYAETLHAHDIPFRSLRE